jgi:hypothetical protein
MLDNELGIQHLHSAGMLKIQALHGLALHRPKFNLNRLVPVSNARVGDLEMLCLAEQPGPHRYADNQTFDLPIER